MFPYKMSIFGHKHFKQKLISKFYFYFNSTTISYSINCIRITFLIFKLLINFDENGSFDQKNITDEIF